MGLYGEDAARAFFLRVSEVLQAHREMGVAALGLACFNYRRLEGRDVDI